MLDGIPISQAVEQIKKYAHEGVFTGLFSLVQIFVAMNPDETLYFANPGPDGKFNDDYYFHWADFYNQPMNDWQKIAEHLLSIPMAHEMIGFYNVADDTDATLKVMRSYQYYAARAISRRVEERKWREKDQRGGHIWHTTGSGKTLTSFKSAHLIAESGDADKVVFLVDRIELGTQSLDDYRNFADDATTVQETKSTVSLITKLKSPSGNHILAQAKSVVNSSTDFRNVRANLKKALESLSEGSKKVTAEKLIYITNSPNPLKDDASRSIFWGPAHRQFSTLPASSQKIITDYLSGIDNPLNTDQFMIQVVPFETDDDNEKYKAVMQSINDFLGGLKLDVQGIGKQLHQVWRGEVFNNGTKKNKTEFAQKRITEA